MKIQRLVEEDKKRLVDENTHLRQELKERYDFSSIIGTSGPVRQMYEQMAQVAATNTTVLIRGESGTGKELVAHSIHYNSPRANKPFVKVSCAALPDSLIESELFGYERGAFTGAEQRKKGRFELAEGGTLFLDEIGDINLSTQVKLLRVLQEREFERLGSTETMKVNVRMVAATNKDMERAIAAGTFREDLYYRLNVFIIFVPPLRERKADLLLLVDHFLEKFSREHHKNIKRISTPAIDMLMSYHWPGNVRELENTLERAVLMCDGQVIHGHHLPPSLQTAEASEHGDPRLAVGRGGRFREGPDSGRAEDHARQPRQGGAPARHHRTGAELQGEEVRRRRAPVHFVRPAGAIVLPRRRLRASSQAPGRERDAHKRQAEDGRQARASGHRLPLRRDTSSWRPAPARSGVASQRVPGQVADGCAPSTAAAGPCSSTPRVPCLAPAAGERHPDLEGHPIATESAVRARRHGQPRMNRTAPPRLTPIVWIQSSARSRRKIIPRNGKIAATTRKRQ